MENTLATIVFHKYEALTQLQCLLLLTHSKLLRHFCFRIDSPLKSSIRLLAYFTLDIPTTEPTALPSILFFAFREMHKHTCNQQTKRPTTPIRLQSDRGLYASCSTHTQNFAMLTNTHAHTHSLSQLQMLWRLGYGLFVLFGYFQFENRFCAVRLCCAFYSSMFVLIRSNSSVASIIFRCFVQSKKFFFSISQ